MNSEDNVATNFFQKNTRLQTIHILCRTNAVEIIFRRTCAKNDPIFEHIFFLSAVKIALHCDKEQK